MHRLDAQGLFKAGLRVLIPGLVVVQPAELGKDIVAKVNTVKKDIIAGKTKVYTKYADAKAAKAVPADLQAKDD